MLNQINFTLNISLCNLLSDHMKKIEIYTNYFLEMQRKEGYKTVRKPLILNPLMKSN